MSVALKLYEQLTDAGEDKQRAHVIAEAFEKLEERYPEIKDLATQGHVRESELRLLKEIKEVEGKIKETEGRLQKEIMEIEGKIKETEGRLQKEIKETESKLQKEIKELEIKMVTSMHRQTLWIIGSVGAMIGAFRALDMLLHAGIPAH